MAVTEGNRLFILGDSQVGKTTIVRHLFKNHGLVLVSSEDGATEYEAFPQGRELPIKILEIQNFAYLSKKAIEFNGEKDAALFCYAIDDPGSFGNVAYQWIPLFFAHVCRTMVMVLVGTKKDLNGNRQVMRNLAKRRLQPVREYLADELLRNHYAIDAFVESSINNFEALDKVFKIICGTVLNYDCK